MESRKKILIISEAHLIRTFVLETVSKLKAETGVRFDCFITATIDNSTRDSLKDVFEAIYVNEYPKGLFRRLPKIRFFQTIYGLRKMAKVVGEYDIVHICFHHYYFAFFTAIIRKKTKRLFLTFFGSDFNQVSRFRHYLNQKTVNRLDGIFATNNTMLQKILKKYSFPNSSIKSGTLVPMMATFTSFHEFLNNHSENLAKQEWNIPEKLVTCGYSAAPIVRHEIIIDSLNKIAHKLSEFKVVFPMTYGSRGEEMRSMVKEKLAASSFNAEILENYLPKEKIQSLCLATDIFIHIQKRDQMSASMLEHLASGSVVITGSWLPYESLIEKGVYFVLLDSPDELPLLLSQVIDNFEEYKNKSKINRKIVLDMMGWNEIKKNWYKYYELVEKL